MMQDLKSSFLLLIVMTVITGLFYPFLVTGGAQVLFPHQANGSLIGKDGGRADKEAAAGPALVGQPFGDPKYFWGRPSATLPFPYNGGASSGSNQGPLNPALADAVEGRIKTLRAADPSNTRPVPADLVTASASGLDPHISPAAADYQVGRVARARRADPQQVRARVALATEGRQLGFFGEPRVNVLKLNLLLDASAEPR